MLKYETIIYWIEEDQAFVAKAPELPGCMAYGESYKSALSSLQEAMHLGMDAA